MASPVNSVTGAAAGANQLQATSEQSALEASGLASDLDTFLQLLTAQLRNQDPQAPTDSTEWVWQLATFSGVEQQVTTNTKLDDLIAMQTNGQLTELASWIGKDVSGSGVNFSFDGENLDIDVPADPNADRVSVVIRDKDGREAATLAANEAGGTVSWDGKRSDNRDATAGTYSVEFVYGSGQGDDSETWTVPANGSGRVIEARLNDAGTPELVLAGGAVTAISGVTSVREPDADAES